jgi:hypothetical protein
VTRSSDPCAPQGAGWLDEVTQHATISHPVRLIVMSCIGHGLDISEFDFLTCGPRWIWTT